MYKKITLATLLLFSFSTLYADYTLQSGKRLKSRIDYMPKGVVADMKQIPQNLSFYAKQIKHFPLWKQKKLDKVFNEKYFKTIKEFEITKNCEKEIKKWLYNLPIPFDKFVYIDSERSGEAVMLTWKMVIKYWEGIFFADDLIIFDKTLNWGLFYFHEDYLYYGTDKIYDKDFEYEKTKELIELKQKFFKKDNHSFNNDEKKKAINTFKEKYNISNIE